MLLNRFTCPTFPDPNKAFGVIPIPSILFSIENDMRFECFRCVTFHNYPLQGAFTEKLMLSGFYYTGCDMKVMCPFCSLRVDSFINESNLLESRSPMVVHQSLSPACPFVRNVECGNISIKVCAASGTTWHNKHHAGWQLPAFYPKVELTKYNLLSERLRTFVRWPLGVIQRPNELANAGFYYFGIQDQVICFCCRGTLHGWDFGDDPLEAHCKYYNLCVYARAQYEQRGSEELNI